MNQQYNPIKAYGRAAHTVAKTRQVVMLYDGIIRFMKQAAEAMEAGAIEERYLKLTRASEVVSGLQNSLDFDSGGQTAQVLFDFYSSVDARIIGMHRQPDAAVCQAIIADLKDMRDVWDGIDRGKEGENLAPVAPGAAVDNSEQAPGVLPTSITVSA